MGTIKEKFINDETSPLVFKKEQIQTKAIQTSFPRKENTNSSTFILKLFLIFSKE